MGIPMVPTPGARVNADVKVKMMLVFWSCPGLKCGMLLEEQMRGEKSVVHLSHVSLARCIRCLSLELRTKV